MAIGAILGVGSALVQSGIAGKIFGGIGKMFSGIRNKSENRKISKADSVRDKFAADSNYSPTKKEQKWLKRGDQAQSKQDKRAGKPEFDGEQTFNNFASSMPGMLSGAQGMYNDAKTYGGNAMQDFREGNSTGGAHQINQGIGNFMNQAGTMFNQAKGNIAYGSQSVQPLSRQGGNGGNPMYKKRQQGY